LIESPTHSATDFSLATKIVQRAIKSPAPRGGADEGCKLAVLLVADALQLKPSDILAAKRGSSANARARQAAMYLAHVALGISLTAIGRFFARDHSTVAHGCRCVEDRRDDPAFDTMIAELALAARLASHLDCEVTA
jgi:chromosomal replication initiation ATPase DnaA